MAIWGKCTGMVEVEITSADPEKTIGLICEQHLILQSVTRLSGLSFRAEMSKKDYKKLSNIRWKQGERVKISQIHDGCFGFISILRRPFIWCSVLAMAFAAVYLQNHILFYEIQGNQQLSEAYLVETVKECGLYFGKKSKNVHNETIKNAMIHRVPKLKWVGITLKGSVALIHVVEGPDRTSYPKTPSGPGSVIAARDGVVDEVTILNGRSLCKVGQAVKKGQTLISGYTDLGHSILSVRGEGEIFGKTNYQITCSVPFHTAKRIVKEKTRKMYRFRIGKKLINLWNDSGIYSSKCVKIEKAIPIQLPGGYKLPAELIVTQLDSYQENISHKTSHQIDERLMLGQIESYLLSHMIAGQILDQNVKQSRFRDYVILKGSVMAREQLGKFQREEIVN